MPAVQLINSAQRAPVALHHIFNHPPAPVQRTGQRQAPNPIQGSAADRHNGIGVAGAGAVDREGPAGNIERLGAGSPAHRQGSDCLLIAHGHGVGARVGDDGGVARAGHTGSRAPVAGQIPIAPGRIVPGVGCRRCNRRDEPHAARRGEEIGFDLAETAPVRIQAPQSIGARVRKIKF